METKEGLGDRLRTGAFAERQAREAFLWAAEAFADAPERLRRSWRALAEEEGLHLEMILRRMAELGLDVKERPVSDRLWRSLTSCASAREFVDFMAESERRGRAAELRFHELLSERDPLTAAMFARIAQDEERHIALAASAAA